MVVASSRQITIRPLGAVVLVLVTGGIFTLSLFLLTMHNSFFDVTSRSDRVGDDYTVSDVDDVMMYHPGSHVVERDGLQSKSNSITHNDNDNNNNNNNGPNYDSSDDGSLDRYFGIKIDSRISDLPDSRPLICKQLVYRDVLMKNDKNNKRVSLILVYNDYQFYELKKTFSSLLFSNSLPLVGEIIVVDDASTLDYITQEARQYFSNVPNLRLMKTSADEPIGVGKARNLAAKEATHEILVFLDWTVVVGDGWLEPLLDPIVSGGNLNSIVVPHADLITDPVGMNHKSLPDNYTYTVTWSLGIRPFQFTSMTTDWQKTHRVPAVRGDVFAVTRDFFRRIDGYNEDLDEYGGGEHVDLSLKAWFCGGGVVLAVCSRVAITNALDPVKIRSKENRDHITDTWFADRAVFKKAIHRLSSSNLDASFSYKDKTEDGFIASVFSNKIRKPDNCKKITMSRYIDKVAVNMVELRGDAIGYGLLQTGTNRFARIIFVDHKETKIKIKLDECLPAIVTDPRVNNNNNINVNNNNNNIYSNNKILDQYQPSIFQLTNTGTIVTRINNVDMCLTTKENAYLTFELCRYNYNHNYKHKHNNNNYNNINDNNINNDIINNNNDNNNNNADDDFINKQRFVYNVDDHTLKNVWSNYCVMQVTDPDNSTPGDRQIAMVQPCNSYNGGDKGFMKWVFFNL